MSANDGSRSPSARFSFESLVLEVFLTDREIRLVSPVSINWLCWAELIHSKTLPFCASDRICPYPFDVKVRIVMKVKKADKRKTLIV